RPDAVAVLGAYRPVLLSRGCRPPPDRLAAGRRVPGAVLLVEIRRLRARRDARPRPAVRPQGARGVAHARPLRDGVRLPRRAWPQSVVARRTRFPAVPL